MRLEELVEKAAQYDERLAKDIDDYVHGRKYGLVYEASKPEFVRMWKKPIVKGDIVNILPPRGVLEDLKSDDDPAEEVYQVINISNNTAKLRHHSGKVIDGVAVDDLVSLARFDKPIYAGLKETGKIQRGYDKPYHVVINGENYHALQTIVYAYQGKVDCIYIDPPYNTGASDWKYNNNYVGKDDVYRHSKWLTFMEDRLRLAKKLLNPKDSTLIVTIDEKEYLRLGLLLEQLFPESLIQMITIVTHPLGQERDQMMARVEEYAFFVFVGGSKAESFPERYLTMPRDFGEKNSNEEVEKEKNVRWERLLRGGGDATRHNNPGLFFPVFIDPTTRRIVSIGEALPLEASRETIKVPKGLVAVFPIRSNGSEGRWRCQPSYLRELVSAGYAKVGTYDKKRNTWTILYLGKAQIARIEKNEISVLGRDENGVVILAAQEDNDDNSISVKTVWNRDSHDAGIYGTQLNSQFIPGRSFPYPKSLYAVEDTLKVVLANKPNALVVDFFAGSGTTAHAIMRLNHADGGRRRSISVTNNEVSEKEVRRFTKNGLRQGDDEWEKYGICEYITKPRITAALTGINSDGNAIEGNYKFTDEFPMSDGFEENIRFFDLKYLEPAIISADLAFESISPILWMCGGCVGEILLRKKGYLVGETYAVLFETRYTKEFIEKTKDNTNIKTVFIVTDVAERYRSLCTELPGKTVHQLYESYLRSFEINAIG